MNKKQDQKESLLVTALPDLPLMLWRYIGLFLDRESLEKFSRTSKFFKRVVEEPFGEPKESLEFRVSSWEPMQYELGKMFTRIAKGHQGVILNILALSPYLVATASADKTIRLWKIGMRKIECLRVMAGHQDEVVVLEKISDKHLLSGGSYGELRLWNFNTGTSTLLAKQKRSYIKPEHSLFAKLFITALSPISPNPSAVVSLCQLPSHRVACGFSNGVIEIWDLIKCKLLTTLKDELRRMKYLGLTHNGYLVGVGNRTYCLWELEKYTLITHNQLFHAQNGSINSAFLLKNGQIVIAGEINSVYVVYFIDIDTHKIEQKYEFFDRIDRISQLSDDVLLFACFSSCSLWSMEKGQCVRKFEYDAVSEMNKGGGVTALSSGEIAIHVKPGYKIRRIFNEKASDLTILRFSSVPTVHRENEMEDFQKEEENSLN